MQHAGEALERAATVLRGALDVVCGRVEDGDVPAWCEARGWTSFLLSLTDAEIASAETGAFDAIAMRARGAPSDLFDLVLEARDAVVLPRIAASPRPLSSAGLRLVPARKRLQIEALLGAIEPMATRAARLVDVGAGRGHLTRFAASSFDRDALGLELDAVRVDAATELAGPSTKARFEVFDACAAPLALDARDLALGLHACGEVGDRLVVEAARAGASIALVSCCLQKISAEARLPLAQKAEGLVIPRDALGLANLSMHAGGVETTLVVTMQARAARLGLRRLLAARGLDVKPGEEMRGINRRRARAGLGELAAAALARRGLPAPSDAEIEVHTRAAEHHFARARRLSLPRSLLARLVEVTLVLDRAARLEEAGLVVRFGTLFDAAISPRNLAVFASRDANGLPPVASQCR